VRDAASAVPATGAKHFLTARDILSPHDRFRCGPVHRSSRGPGLARWRPEVRNDTPPEVRPRLIRRGRLIVLAVAATAACAHPPSPAMTPDVRVGGPALVRTLEAHTAAPVIAGNRVDLLVNEAEIFPATLEAIRAARHTITYAQYYWGEGEVGRVLAEAFAERCERGVAVTVLLDAFGTLGMPDIHRRRLEDAGCRVTIFRPFTTTPPREANHRQHARILVVDGRIGFTGGSGVSEDWIGSRDGVWRETDVRVEGPAVAELQAAFVRRWSEATGERLGGAAYFPALETAGPVPVQVVDGRPWHGQRSIQDLFLLCFAGAHQSVLVSNPYDSDRCCGPASRSTSTRRRGSTRRPRSWTGRSRSWAARTSIRARWPSTPSSMSSPTRRTSRAASPARSRPTSRGLAASIRRRGMGVRGRSVCSSCCSAPRSVPALRDFSSPFHSSLISFRQCRSQDEDFRRRAGAFLLRWPGRKARRSSSAAGSSQPPSARWIR
jgi:hypothetical protein